MLSRMVTVLFLGIAIGLSGSFETKGRVTEEWPKSSFVVSVKEGPAKLWFSLPQKSRISVVLEHGRLGKNRQRLTGSNLVELPDSGAWTVTVAWDSSDCDWRCQQASGSELVLKKISGYADTLFPFRFSLSTEQDLEIWEFSYPKDATFIVRQSWPGAKAPEEQDLADDPQLRLIGGGRFDIEVAPVEGGGEFSARLVE
ncbi:MAG: hypothetical protein ABIK44_03855 [candidate division WOR-3 bacterium]